MSFMHSIIFNSVMKSKKTYVPGTIDYDKRRKDEMEQVSLMMYEKLKSEGVDVSLYRRDGMMHAWMIIPVFKEAKEDLKILKIDMGKALFG